MKYLVPAFLLLGTFYSGHANLWMGSITETITSTNDPYLSVGEVFTGTYQYTSTGSDGTFYVNLPGSTEPNATLTGMLFNGVVGPYSPPGDLSAIEAAPYATNSITVSGGVVTGFHWQDQSGGNEWIGAGPAAPFTFKFYELQGPGSDSSYETDGTISFSNPIEPVPEARSSTGLLLAPLALVFGWGSLRRRSILK